MSKILILIGIMLIQLISLMVLTIWTLSTFMNKKIEKDVLIKQVTKKYLPLIIIDIVIFSFILYKIGYDLFLVIELIVVLISIILNTWTIKKKKIIDTIIKKD